MTSPQVQNDDCEKAKVKSKIKIHRLCIFLILQPYSSEFTATINTYNQYLYELQTSSLYPLITLSMYNQEFVFYCP